MSSLSSETLIAGAGAAMAVVLAIAASLLLLIVSALAAATGPGAPAVRSTMGACGVGTGDRLLFRRAFAAGGSWAGLLVDRLVCS